MEDGRWKMEDGSFTAFRMTRGWGAGEGARCPRALYGAGAGALLGCIVYDVPTDGWVKSQNIYLLVVQRGTRVGLG